MRYFCEKILDVPTSDMQTPRYPAYMRISATRYPALLESQLLCDVLCVAIMPARQMRAVVHQVSTAVVTTTAQHIAPTTSLRACTQKSFTCVYGPAVPVGAAVGAVATQHTVNVHAQA
eukprot:1829-Heterococcus_DN1.PRE.4